MAGSACASERTIKIATLITDSTTERDVSETQSINSNDTSESHALTSFTDSVGSTIVRVVAQLGSGYSGGTFCVSKMDTGGAGTIIELNVLDGAGGERIGMYWPSGASGPGVKHTVARTVGGHEDIVYNVTLDTTA